MALFIYTWAQLRYSWTISKAAYVGAEFLFIYYWQAAGGPNPSLPSIFFQKSQNHFTVMPFILSYTHASWADRFVLMTKSHKKKLKNVHKKFCCRCGFLNLCKRHKNVPFSLPFCWGQKWILLCQVLKV